MSTVVLDVAKRDWMSSNRPVKHHGHRQSIRDRLHDQTILTARAARLKPFDGPVSVVWTIAYPKGVGWVHGDAANAHPTCKAILDALVPRWLEGDGPRFVVSETFRRGPNLDVPAIHRVTAEITTT